MWIGLGEGSISKMVEVHKHPKSKTHSSPQLRGGFTYRKTSLYYFFFLAVVTKDCGNNAAFHQNILIIDLGLMCLCKLMKSS